VAEAGGSETCREGELAAEAEREQISSTEIRARSLLFSPLLARGMGRLIYGEDKPIMGWRSRIFWQKEPCHSLSIKGRFRGPVLLESCVLSVPSGESEAGKVSFSNADPEGRLYSLIRRETTSCIETSLVNLGEGVAGEGGLESDAAYLCLREFPATGVLELLGRNVGKVLRNGEPLVDATDKLQFVKARIEREAIRFDARGTGAVLVRAHKSVSMVSSAPGFEHRREGEFIRLSHRTH